MWLATEMLLMPVVFPNEIEIQIMQKSGGSTLVAATELIGPRHKNRPEARRTIAARCAASLQRGIGLMIVDVVTERLANLQNEPIVPMDLELTAMRTWQRIVL